MTKYKIKRLGEKEVQALHKTKPIAVLVDGRPVQFFENEQKAQDMLIDQKNYDAVAEQLGKWVRQKEDVGLRGLGDSSRAVRGTAA